MRAETFVENAWYGAGLSADFKARDLQSHVIAGKPIVLWRDDDGTVVAFDDRCVHKRMQLSAGRFLDDGTVECAYHGLCYDSTGTCVKIPSQPGQPISSKAKLKPHRLVRAGRHRLAMARRPGQDRQLPPAAVAGNRQR